jgi:hypothetical protein
MPAPWWKPLETLAAEDLRALVLASAQESETLEFKGTMYHPTDGGTRELLKDVASMANQRGGRLMIGVAEDATGTARSADGVDCPEAVERILGTCYANIEPRVAGLDGRHVDVDEGRTVVVVHIPESLAGPHIVTFQQVNLFWRRYGRQNQRMSVREIEAAFYRRFQAGEALHRFIDERKSEVYVALGGGRGLLLTCTPVHLRDEAVDIHDQQIRLFMQSPPQPPGRQDGSVGCGDVLPSLHGLSARRQGRPDHLDVWRNGHIEFLATRPWGEGRDAIPSVLMARFIYSFALLALQVYEHAGIESPSVVTCSLLNARGLHLAVVRDPFDDMAQRPWQDDTLEADPVYAETVASLHEVPQRVMDRLYNAFGLDRCDLFDENGHLVTP